MQTEIDKYRIVSKIFEGADLRLVFQNNYDTTDRKILELKELVGFIENIEPGKPIQMLRLDKEGSSYSMDRSLRLQRPGINNFPEFFIFVDTACVNFCFRAIAKFIELIDWTEKDKWLP